jgi:hypothetical protein
MPRIITTNIAQTECIGDSLTKINNNDLKLDEHVQTLSAFFPVQNSSIAFDGGAFCFRNKLINAQGLINQRNYVSGTATTQVNQYTLDRWRVVTSGQSLTFTTTNNVVTFAVPAGGLEQVIEGNNIESGTYELNWTGTATATVNGTARAKGATFTLTGGSDVTVRFINGTVSLPQLERGNTATPFEYRPFSVELSLCQRYFEKSYPINIAPGTANIYQGADYQVQAVYTTNPYAGALITSTFKVTKRTSAPAITVYNPDNGTPNQLTIFSAGATFDRNVSISTPAVDHKGVRIWPASGTTVNSGYICITHWAVDAEL